MNLKSSHRLVYAACFALISSVNAADFIKPTPWSSLVTNDIQRFLPTDEVRPLLAGEDEFISLYRQSMAASQRGIVLIIPDWQHLPTNNAGINFLRKQLNEIGYATLAMTMPDIDWHPADMAMPEPSENSEDAEESTTQSDEQTAPATPAQAQQAPHFVTGAPNISEAVLDDYKLKLIARFNALYNSAMDEGGNIVVVAQGASAGLLIEHYASFPNNELNAFISLGSYLPNSIRNQHLNATLSTISPPLLDIFYSEGNPDTLQSVKDRKRWVRKHAKYDYRQRELFGVPSEPEQHERLLKEVDGFLRRLF
ncbi:alpha/beta hydrolase family protein [Pseudoalteromonas shioyasakiensis]|nr:alpha/beta hydrolase family protein [Pseudoalteromonas shioyasakiensis]